MFMRLLRRPGIFVALAAFATLPAATAPADDSVPLNGKWRFQLDRGDAGLRERWFARELTGSIRLPGTLAAQGVGDEVSTNTVWVGGIVDRSWFTAPEYAAYRQPGNVKVPFWLTPDKYYMGPAWYQREIQVPEKWRGNRLVLRLERPHWETRVWLDGRELGFNKAISVPHDYDLGVNLAPGKHTLTVRVDNRLVVDVGENSHCVTDHTQGNWNGIAGAIELVATPRVWIEDAQVYPDIAAGKLRLNVRVGNATGEQCGGTLRTALTQKKSSTRQERQAAVAIATRADKLDIDLPIPAGLQLWDEFNPATCVLDLALETPSGTHRSSVAFGVREVSAQGTRIAINGRPIFLRGTLECAIFPRTGHPPTDPDEWKRIIRVAKAHGLNLFRFHSYCPPEAAFVAADELGFYFQVETCWPNQSTTIGDGKPVDEWVYAETDRILKAYGNHPSFLLMAHGNEPGGDKANAYLAKYVTHFKQKDSRRLWTSGSGWPQLPENQFHVTPDPRIQAWGGGNGSRINAKPPETVTDYRDYIGQRPVPVISHEIGQWCVYPNFAELPKYKGYLKARNFEIFRDLLDRGGMGRLAREFLLASGKLQTLCYKEDIESALRTPGMGGFQLLDLHDFPGQGTALVGVLDPFWGEKGYVTAKEYHRFSGSTVPLARLGKRVFTTGDRLEADIEIAHFGPEPLKAAVAYWDFSCGGKTLARGKFDPRDIPVGNGIALGKISIDLKAAAAPAKGKLTVGLDQTRFENDWDVWVYPAVLNAQAADDILVTREFDESAERHAARGGKVLLTIPGPQVRNYEQNPVKLGFSSIFWNTAWTGRQAPTTLGILCDPRHPALAGFPTDYHSNWQWWYLIHQAGALRLDGLPAGKDPIVRIIDDWFTARPLGLVIEGRLGQGRIVICGVDLTREQDTNPVARQLRHSLVSYMRTDKFKPQAELTAGQVRSLINPPSLMQKLGAKVVRTSSAQPGFPGENALDGNPGTMWHTTWNDGVATFPHELVIGFDQPARIGRVSALPRQDGQRNGWIKDYEIYASADGKDWGQPVAKGAWPADAALQTAKVETGPQTRFLRLVVLSGHANGPWASLAELTVSGP